MQQSIIFSLAYLLSLLYLGSELLSGRLELAAFFNSDAIYPYFFSSDLITAPNRLAGWVPPPAPYFFPDLLLYLPVRMITADPHLAGTIYFILQQFAYLAVLFYFWLTVERQSPLPYTLLSLTVINLLTVSSYSFFFIHFYNIAHHSGQVMMTLLLLGITGRLPGIEESNGSSARHSYLFLFIITALTVLSDKLFIISSLAPLMVAGVAALLILPERKSIIHYLLIVAAATFTGLQLYKFLPLITIPIDFKPLEPSVIITSLTHNLKQIASYLKNNIGLVLLQLSALLITIYRGWVEYRDGLRRGIFRLLIVLMAIMIPLSILFAVSLKGIELDSQSFRRYFIALFTLLPLLLISNLSALRFQRKFLYGCGVALLLLTVTMIFVSGVSSKLTVRTDFRSERHECLANLAERYELKNGLANYWLAKELTAALGGEPWLNQVTAEFKPYFWINNRYWYEKRRYDFVITTELNREMVLDVAGKPTLSESCGGLQFEIFRPPFQLPH